MAADMNSSDQPLPPGMADRIRQTPMPQNAPSYLQNLWQSAQNAPQGGVTPANPSALGAAQTMFPGRSRQMQAQQIGGGVVEQLPPDMLARIQANLNPEALARFNAVRQGMQPNPANDPMTVQPQGGTPPVMPQFRQRLQDALQQRGQVPPWLQDTASGQ